MNNQIFIILAVYNGADFLGEQLESLLGQTEAHWTLLLRDDGSTDGSVEIIQDFVDGDKRIRVLPGGGQSTGSALGNFTILLDSALADGAQYVFCCDQDDVWAPDKLERVLARLKQLEGEGGAPSLVHHDLVVVDETLEPLANSFVELMGLQPGDQHNPQRLISRNEVTGCAMACNRALLEIALPVSSQAVMHDWWLALCAGYFGRLEYMPEKLLKYRQHDNNTIGAKSFWHGLNPLSNWVVGWKRGDEEFLSTVKQAKAFQLAMIDRLKQDAVHLAILERYCELATATRWQRLRTIGQFGLWRTHWLLNVVVVMRMILLPRKPIQ